MRMFTKSYIRHERTTSNRQRLPNCQIIYNCVVLKIILLEYVICILQSISSEFPVVLQSQSSTLQYYQYIISFRLLARLWTYVPTCTTFASTYRRDMPFPYSYRTYIILYMRSRFSSFNYVSSSIIIIYVVYEYVYSSRAFIIRVPYNIIANIKLSVVECWRRVNTHYYENVPM